MGLAITQGLIDRRGMVSFILKELASLILPWRRASRRVPEGARKSPSQQPRQDRDLVDRTQVRLASVRIKMLSSNSDLPDLISQKLPIKKEAQTIKTIQHSPVIPRKCATSWAPRQVLIKGSTSMTVTTLHLPKYINKQATKASHP